MNIDSNYQLRSFKFNSRVDKQQLQTNPSFGMNNKLAATVATGLAVTAGTVLAMQNGKTKAEDKPIEADTIYGPVIYTPKGNGEKSSLVVSRPNKMKIDLFENIPQAVLESPVMEHVHQIKCSTINPKVGVLLKQNKSDNTVTARVIALDGTLENTLVNNNMRNIPIKYDHNMYADTPWYPGRQDVNQRCLQVTYGTVKEDWGARHEYIAEYADPETGEAPDVGTLAAQKGTEDRSFVPADIAQGQYEIVTETGERIVCDYDSMVPGRDYKIAKKECDLKMAVPSEEVISSEGEKLPAGKLYMVDSMGHFYNGNPIKRIKSGEVTWNADMNDPVQAQIRNDIDESSRLEKEAKALKKEAAELSKQERALRKDAEPTSKPRTLKDVRRNRERALPLIQEANKLAAKAEYLNRLVARMNAQAKQATARAEQGMTEWVKSAQNPEGVEFFVES